MRGVPCRAVPPEAGSGGRRLPPLLGKGLLLSEDAGCIPLHDLHVFLSPPSPCVDFNGEEQATLNPFPLAELLRGDTGRDRILPLGHAMHIFNQKIPSLQAM